MRLIEEINEEVMRAINKFPTWPTDPLHALAVLGEEYGELTKIAREASAFRPGRDSAPRKARSDAG